MSQRLRLSPEQVRIAVHAAGVNRADLSQSKGHYPPPQGVTEVLGLECAGVVVETGAESLYQEGQRVMALVSGGAWAEECIAHSGSCFLIPDSWTYEEAAAFPESAMTFAAHALFAGDLKSGETIFLPGGASGLAAGVIPLAKFLGCKVWASCTDEKKAQFARDLGADRVWVWSEPPKENPRRPDSGPDVILDFLAGDWISFYLQWLNPRGRLVSINAQKKEPAPLSQNSVFTMMSRRLSWMGATLRSQTDEEKAQYAGRLRDSLKTPSDWEKVKPKVTQIFSFEEQELALQWMEQKMRKGKAVISRVQSRR